MTAKHPKLKRPTNVNLVRNPLIGGSKGVTMAQATPDDLDEMQAANTFEGDVENDTNAAGGIEEFDQERGRRRRHERDQGPRRTVLQGKKTHEQQLRMLERKPDVPDSRQIKQELPQMAGRGAARRPREGARQSEFAVSRGGVNQESQHNKHNHQSQTGHKPPKTKAART